MIGKFLQSKISGYLSIIAVIIVLGLVFYIYREGKNACIGDVVKEQVEVNQKSIKGANDVRKDEQRFNLIELDRQLCALGIMREDDSCK